MIVISPGSEIVYAVTRNLGSIIFKPTWMTRTTISLNVTSWREHTDDELMVKRETESISAMIYRWRWMMKWQLRSDGNECGMGMSREWRLTPATCLKITSLQISLRCKSSNIIKNTCHAISKLRLSPILISNNYLLSTGRILRKFKKFILRV